MDHTTRSLLNALLQDHGEWIPRYDPGSILLALLLAFVLGQLLAWVYAWTHSGLSYSRSFAQSLVLLTMVVAMVMFVIGNSIVAAFGLIGALAIIRFRNVLKDTRDTVFIFVALVTGMAIGSERHLAAILGCAGVLLASLYLHWTGFGARDRYDGHLSCRLRAGTPADGELQAVLGRFCRAVKRISVRHGAGLTELVYQIRLRDPARGEEMVAALEGLPGVGEAALILREELQEV